MYIPYQGRKILAEHTVKREPLESAEIAVFLTSCQNCNIKFMAEMPEDTVILLHNHFAIVSKILEEAELLYESFKLLPYLTSHTEGKFYHLVLNSENKRLDLTLIMCAE